MQPRENDNESIGGGARRKSVLFRHADFMKLWTGETVSLFGTRMGDVAISFAAVIALKATPFQMGILAVGRGLSAPDLFFDVAYRSYLPSLVEHEDLLDANSKLTASAGVAEAGGFALSGWLVEWLTAPFAILIDAISFLASALAIALIRKPEPAPTPRARGSTVAREIADGARLVFSDGRLRAFGVNVIVGGFANSLVGTLYMLYVVNALGFRPGVLGVIFAVGGASSLFGALAARRTADVLGTGRAMVA